MSSLLVDLFAEDRAHEAFLEPLIRRIAVEERATVTIRVRCARGGHGRVLEEYRIYQRLMSKGAIAQAAPDLLVVAIDGNCTTFAKKREEIVEASDAVSHDRLVTACPDPHVERWFLADPDSFHSVVGHRPEAGRRKCQRDHYKRLLQAAVQQAGHPPTLGGIEFAEDLIPSMDLYRAGRNDKSLKAFVDDLRAKARRLIESKSS